MSASRNATTSPSIEVSEFELEMYHDGDLDPSRRDAICAALERDDALRSRLDAIARADMLVAGAQTRPVDHQRGRGSGLAWAPLGFGVACLGFACVGLLVATLIAWRGTGSPQVGPLDRERGPGPMVMADQGSADASGWPVESELPAATRVVLIVPGDRFEAMERMAAPADPRAQTGARAGAQSGARLAELLRSGDAEGAAQMIAGADEADRRALAEEMSRLLRSTRTLEVALESLSPEDRLDVCLIWLERPAFRGATMDQIAKLAGDPAIAGRVMDEMDRLSEDPAMRPWLASYGLRRDDGAGGRGRH